MKLSDWLVSPIHSYLSLVGENRLWWTLNKVNRPCSQNILTYHMKSTGADNKMNDGWTEFSCLSFRVLLLCILAHCHSLLEHLNIEQIMYMKLLGGYMYPFLPWNYAWSLKNKIVKETISYDGYIVAKKSLCCIVTFFTLHSSRKMINFHNSRSIGRLACSQDGRGGQRSLRRQEEAFR